MAVNVVQYRGLGRVSTLSGTRGGPPDTMQAPAVMLAKDTQAVSGTAANITLEADTELVIVTSVAESFRIEVGVGATADADSQLIPQNIPFCVWINKGQNWRISLIQA